MSKTEDYLDSLLNNVTPERKAESKRKRRKRKTNYEEDFENELNGADEDSFAREFEADVDTKDTTDSFFDDLEGIIDQINKPLREEPEIPEESRKPEDPEEEVFEINTLADDTWTEEPKPEELSAQESRPEVELVGDLDSLDELLEAENKGKSGGTGKEKKPGFFKKLGAALFGKDEDALDKEEGSSGPAEALDDGEYEGLDDEQLQILRELNMAESAGTPEPPGDQEKGKKKKEKKMKKEKKAKEKKPKEKKPKK